MASHRASLLLLASSRCKFAKIQIPRISLLQLANFSKVTGRLQPTLKRGKDPFLNEPMESYISKWLEHRDALASVIKEQMKFHSRSKYDAVTWRAFVVQEFHRRMNVTTSSTPRTPLKKKVLYVAPVVGLLFWWISEAGKDVKRLQIARGSRAGPRERGRLDGMLIRPDPIEAPSQKSLQTVISPQS